VAPEDSDGGFEIVEYCGRLSCKKPIVQSAGRGRRREFCSETCRRGADKDYKRAKALVEHFEQNLTKTRHEVAAYGRKAETDGGFRPPTEEAEVGAVARAAISRAEGILEFSAGDDPFRQELARLVEAVRVLAPAPAARASA
jgi:hypothetical protein